MLFEYKVNMCSVPGMYTQYSFDVKVTARNEEEAAYKAYNKLKPCFPDRSMSTWKIEKVELIK